MKYLPLIAILVIPSKALAVGGIWTYGSLLHTIQAHFETWTALWAG